MMNNHKFFVCLFCLFVFFQFPLSAQDRPEEHSVSQGETLNSIAREYGVSVDELLRWNQLTSPSISVGQTLKLGPPEAENQVTHIVEAGQTLFAISREYGVTIPEIQQWNNISGTDLEVGQELILYPSESNAPETLPPAGEEAESQNTLRESIVRIPENSSGSTYYTVKSGDTLTRIAREHNMSVDELRNINDLEGDAIRVGQQLTVREIRSAPSVAESNEESTPQGKFVLYRVEQGETGRDILRKFTMSESEFNSLNPGLSMSAVSSGQRITVLLPPNRTFKNPFREGADLEDLGSMTAMRYSENDIAQPTTSGELYNPNQLTAAHSNMALGNIIYVENPNTGSGIYVRVNDRQTADGLKLSHKAFEMLGFNNTSSSRVTIYLDN